MLVILQQHYIIMRATKKYAQHELVVNHPPSPVKYVFSIRIAASNAARKDSP